MEFTPELSAFQGIITTADSAYSFSELKSKGGKIISFKLLYTDVGSIILCDELGVIHNCIQFSGNEEKIKYVVDCLRRFLQREGYIQENNVSQGKAHTVRKFAFYICLNSDLPILEELVDLDGIAFLIWTVPVIRKCLMCEILWKLHMEKFIYEMLVFTCPLLSLEVAEALLDHFKYFDPTECLQNLKLLSLGCYRMICRLVFFELEGDEITRSYNNFQKCLKYFSEPPNVSKLGRLSEDDEYKYIGRRLYEMLLLISDCFTYYIVPQQFKPADFQDIYELSYLDGIVINEQLSVSMSQSSNSDILECINNCNTALLDTCQTLAMEVSVDIFCAWSEFEENGRSMQQTIGELCYNVHTQLSKISSVSGHPVVAMLQLISCKPKDLVEVINNSDTSVIMEKISKEDNEGSQWIKALIYKDNLCQNLNLIEKIASHLHILNEFECCKLFKIIYTYLQDNNMENREMFLCLAMKVFQRCSSSSKHEIVDEHYSDANFNNNLETTEFSNMVTETFNKLIISTDADLSDVLTVFIQNPRSVYRKIFHLASVNTHQADIMFKVMKCLEKYSKHYYKEETEPCIIQVTKEVIVGDLDTESNQDNFIGFLKNMKCAKAIPAPKLLLLIIMPNLHSGLLNKNFTQISIQCKLLQAAYNIEELVEYRAPALAMLAQVLDTVRWKMDTYVVQAPSTLELVLQLQTALYTSDLTGDCFISRDLGLYHHQFSYNVSKKIFKTILQ